MTALPWSAMTAAGGWHIAWLSTTRGRSSDWRCSTSHRRQRCTPAPIRSSPPATFGGSFLIQPEDLPERLIAAGPEYFLRKHIESQIKTAGAVDEAVFKKYLRCYSDPATRHAICEDYRAEATIDLKHDAADGERKVAVPLLALWGAKGVVGQLYDVLATWREKAAHVRGRALECGHTLQEEAPEDVLRELLAFLMD